MRAIRAARFGGAALSACLLWACGDQTHVVGSIDEGLAQTLPKQDAPAAGVSNPAGGNAPPLIGEPISRGDPDDSGGTGADTPLAGVGAFAPGTVQWECDPSTRPATRRRLDMYLMVDSAITLPFSGAWDNVTQGIVGYVNDAHAEGTAVGLNLFGLECSPEAYIEPRVPIAPLPDNAQRISRALPPFPFSGSAVLPALEGAITFARSRANAFPQYSTVVVLITDGALDPICMSDAPDLYAAARAGFREPPSVPTYVLALQSASIAGLPNTLAQLLGLDDLDLLAATGGTGRAWTINVEDPPQTLTRALLEVQQDAESCEFAVPVDTDESYWSLGIDASPSPPIPLRRVDDIGGCIGGGGYYFVDTADGSRWAAACPTTCRDIKSGPYRVLELTGCAVE